MSNICFVVFSYEIGVLFLPKQFSRTTFPVFDTPAFPMPYDLPPVKYQSTGNASVHEAINSTKMPWFLLLDKPWICDIAYKDRPDTHGNMWDPHG